jgi:ornithine carbamoyltransferase
MHNFKHTVSSSQTPDGTASTRHFLRDDDLTSEEYAQVLELALELKAEPHKLQPLKAENADGIQASKSAAVIFDKNSTRTRVSFATAVAHIGGYPMIIDSGTSQLSRGEPIPDTAHVLERMCEAIIWRTFSQSNVEEMAANSSKPVVNALTDTFHPCQVLADLAAFALIGDSSNLFPSGAVKIDTDYAKLNNSDKVKGLKGKTVAYLGDGANNMAHSYLLGCANAGMNIRIGCPDDYSPSSSIVADAKSLAEQNGVQVIVTNDPVEAIQGADLVTTDAWLSMGMDKSETEMRAKALGKYQINIDLWRHAAPNAVFMHCLPAYRGQEVTTDIIDGPSSAIFEEAEFRLHAQKALLCWLMQNS